MALSVLRVPWVRPPISARIPSEIESPPASSRALLIRIPDPSRVWLGNSSLAERPCTWRARSKAALLLIRAAIIG